MNPYVVVLFSDGSGYTLNRDYSLMLVFANACQSWQQSVREKCFKTVKARLTGCINYKGLSIMYTTKNYKSKAALKRAITAGEEVTIFQPGPFGGNEPTDGSTTLEGPHYPAPHTWYAQAELKDGKIIKVK